MSTEPEHFNPAEKFTNLQGQLYLEVKWRIVWLRDDAPESQIRCEHIVLTEQLAVFKATVTRIVDGEVRGVGEGYGSEQPKDFKDYIEKAETKAIGRALASLGYGTAAAFEEDPTRIADAPVKVAPAERRQSTQLAPPGLETHPRQAARPQAGPGEVTEKQIKYLFGLAGEANPDKDTSTEDFLHGQIYARFKVAHVPQLTKHQGSQMVDYLKNRDFVDGEMPPNGRVDPVEAGQQGLAGVPEEPAWMRKDPYVN